MAKLSADGKYVTVEQGDTLGEIAEDFAGGYSKYKKLAEWNGISNPDLISIGQKIYLSADGSSSSGSSSGSSEQEQTTTSNKVTIKNFGALSTDPNKLFVTWEWGQQSKTESYKILWKYTTVDGLTFSTTQTNTVDEDYYAGSRYATYDIPEGAKKVTAQVMPVSKKYKKDDKETTYFTGEWSTVTSDTTYTNGTPLTEPSQPTLTADGLKLTAEIKDVGDLYADQIEFKLIKNDTTVVGTKSASINTQTGYVSYAWSTSDAGSTYKVQARAVKGSLYSDWSSYSNEVTTPPSAPKGFKTIKAQTETSVYLTWEAVKSAKSYDIEYTQEKRYFDTSDQTATKSGITSLFFEITGLESGKEYFFRIRAVNEDNTTSDWSGISSCIIGSKPAAPTTWSSSTTAIAGEALNLYWVHNSEDGSSQTYAELELYIGGVKETHTIKNSTEEDEKDLASVYSVNTSTYKEGTQILWRVRTSGITKDYGDWSVQRTIDIYGKPSVEVSFTKLDGSSISSLTSFPGYIRALAGPKTQAPIGYHVEVISNSIYETVDAVGNTIIVNAGEAIYSKHFDINTELLVELSSGNIDLENNISYTIVVTVSMNSGLTVEGSVNFTVAWADDRYAPGAEISIDREVMSAHIRPYCMEGKLVKYRVTKSGNRYTKTSTAVGNLYGEQVGRTTTGEVVYLGMDDNGNDIYFCEVDKSTMVENITLSVYRRTFDGKFVEIATGLDNSKNTTVTDPHPSLDHARYRIVATSTKTGAVSYSDISEPVGHIFGIIQWDEAWSNFETTEEAALEQPPWSGSLVQAMYNLDVTESTELDVEHVDYIGREQSVSYFGTKIGNKCSWNFDIVKSDKETLYTLRRLQRWLGNVYMREPSGLGYWATVTVSFGQTHNTLTIPVTISATRVEGGV